MTINGNTKIAALLKNNPDALDAIVSISPKFEKLRNPILRKLMAGRTSILQASKIGDCSPEDFFAKLKPLGFEVTQVSPVPALPGNEFPSFLKNIAPEKIISFDVRPILNSNADPLQDILGKIKSLQPGEVLKIINSFEPTPLMSLLKKQGFESFANRINENIIETYFYKNKKETKLAGATWEQQPISKGDWDDILKKHEQHVQKIDVRHLEMPQPMLTILAELDKLPAGFVLFVHHKRIPVFLLTELNERGFEYRIKGQGDNEVYLLIFRP